MLIISDKLKVAIYNEDLIVLDVIDDDYYIYESCGYNPDVLNRYSASKIEDFIMGIRKFQKVCHLKPSHKESFLEIRWIRPKVNISPTVINTIFMFFTVLKYKRGVDKFGFLYVYEKIREVRLSRKFKLLRWLFRSSSNDSILSSMNYVTKFFDIKNPCLIYSFVLAMIMKSKGQSVNLVVGVRTRPFFSHSWIELDGKVYKDDIHLRKKLSIIMEI